MSKIINKKIILEDGQVYAGSGFGADVSRVCEIVFNTSMVGYQEIISDPSYTDQAIVMTYPLIGNYGMAADDYETLIPTAGAMIVREYNDEPSNFRSEKTLSQVMKEYQIPGVEGIDTRKLGRSIRDYGSRRALIADADVSVEQALEIIRHTQVPHDAVSRVSRKERLFCPAGGMQAESCVTRRGPLHVVAVDCGMKQNIVRSLNRRGCDVTIAPWNTEAAAIEALQPDGVFISNGPGDPQDVPETIQTIRALIGKYPIFGICLGHQIICLAYGGDTYKLKFGHRGGNHPVKDLSTGKIEITSQNHSYAVEEKSLEGTGLTVTHINLLDRTVEGAACEKDRVFSVQYHPESAPGPQDSAYLFDRFIGLMS